MYLIFLFACCVACYLFLCSVLQDTRKIFSGNATPHTWSQMVLCAVKRIVLTWFPAFCVMRWRCWKLSMKKAATAVEGWISQHFPENGSLPSLQISAENTKSPGLEKKSFLFLLTVKETWQLDEFWPRSEKHCTSKKEDRHLFFSFKTKPTTKMLT